MLRGRSNMPMQIHEVKALHCPFCGSANVHTNYDMGIPGYKLSCRDCHKYSGVVELPEENPDIAPA